MERMETPGRMLGGLRLADKVSGADDHSWIIRREQIPPQHPSAVKAIRGLIRHDHYFMQLSISFSASSSLRLSRRLLTAMRK
jgi:hypothetical protein